MKLSDPSWRNLSLVDGIVLDLSYAASVIEQMHDLSEYMSSVKRNFLPSLFSSDRIFRWN